MKTLLLLLFAGSLSAQTYTVTTSQVPDTTPINIDVNLNYAPPVGSVANMQVNLAGNGSVSFVDTPAANGDYLIGGTLQSQEVSGNTYTWVFLVSDSAQNQHTVTVVMTLTPVLIHINRWTTRWVYDVSNGTVEIQFLS